MATNKSRTFAVIGLGTFGSTIALELERLGNQVLGIDRSEERVRAVVDRLSHAIIADARDERALAEAGVEGYDAAVVAIGEELEASILATLNLKTLGVKTIWAKALSRTHHRILAKLGADRIVHPEHEIGLHVAQILNNPLVVDFIRLGNGFSVVAIEAPASLRGQRAGELGLGERSVRCLGLMRGTTFLDTDAAVEEGDRVLLLGRGEDLRRLESGL